MRERHNYSKKHSGGMRTPEFTAYLKEHYPNYSLDEAETKYWHQKRIEAIGQEWRDNARKSEEMGKILYIAVVAVVLILLYLFT